MCNFSANLHIFYLYLSETEWQEMIISVKLNQFRKKQNNLLTTEVFFSHKIYLRCTKINFEIILRSQCARKKSEWYCMILGQLEII